MPNVRDLLETHEAAVAKRIAELRAELVPLERELLDVRMAKAALKTDAVPEQRRLLFPHAGTEGHSSHVNAWRHRLVYAAHHAPSSPYSKLTIKDLVKKAMVEHFPNGATAAELLDLFWNVWGRTDIERTSLSPQLSRLRNENILFREGHMWRLTAASGLISPNDKAAANR